MSSSWHEAKEEATKAGLPQVYHDCDTEIFGACRQGEEQGVFQEGVFVAHRCICMPAHLSVKELETKEKAFRQENPDW